MKKITIIAVGMLSALLCASVAVAERPADKASKAKNQVAKLCAAEKKADKAAFKATYGKHAMRACIKGETPEMRQEVRNAAQECKAERSADPDAFREEYASNKKGRNAFGKCVSSNVREERVEEVAEFKNAAQACRAERRADRDAFQEQYGSNKNRRNALGKCVSSNVKQTDEEPEGTPAA